MIEVVQHDLDGMVRQFGKTELDARSVHNQPDLDDSLPDHRHLVRLRVRSGVPKKVAVACGVALRHQPRRQPALHAVLLWAAERSAGDGGHCDSVDHHSLDVRGRLEAQ